MHTLATRREYGNGRLATTTTATAATITMVKLFKCKNKNE